MKRTPGPWKLTDYYEGHELPKSGDWVGSIENEAGEEIYRGPFCFHALNNKANATLIAAAPDMLEALERMTKMHKMFCNRIDWKATFLDADTIRELNEAPIQAHVAIAKAKGSD